MTLELIELQCGRGGRPLTDPVSFVVPPGQGVVLRGPNGVGKTTLMRTLAGFLAPISGTARFGPAALGTGDGLQEVLAYAAHADGIKGQMTVRENLEFWSALHGVGGTVEAAMVAFNLEAIGARLAHACSAGQKRRLGLARLMLTGRRLWLLDEPTVSLDHASRGALAECLRGHLAGGGLVVMVTHDVDIVPGLDTVTLAPRRSDRAGASGSGGGDRMDPFLEDGIR